MIALTYIYCIGKTSAEKILADANINPNTKVKDLTEAELGKLRDLLTKYRTEGDLRRKVQMDVKRLQDIGSYRGFRHRRKLPVRGQRTKTNARTKRSGRGTVANKKKVSK